MTFADLVRPSDNNALKDIILDRIRCAGSIPFTDFIDLALYHPELGYYMTADPALDYKSSPNVHRVFGAVLGRALAEMWRAMDRPSRFDVFEAGAGSGRLAADIIAWLKPGEPDFFDALRYMVQDLTYSRPDTEERLGRAGVAVATTGIRQQLPETAEIQGCILTNELLDALPFHRVRVSGGRLTEIDVAAEGHELHDAPVQPRAEVSGYFEALGVLPGEECLAEANLNAPAWMTRAAKALGRGYVLTLDYGYEAPQLYAPWRKRGTLLTFHSHTSGDNPYERIGRQDITASVDFTSVTRAAKEGGLRDIWTGSQGELLAALGIGEALARPDPTNLQGHFDLRRAVLELTDPAGLGRVRVLLQGRDVPEAPPVGFAGPAPAGG